LLAKEFDLPKLEPVIFTNRGSKTPAFRQVQAVLSYGDSDGDIRDSIEAGARPVRVLRAHTSVNVEPVHNGAFGEEVLINSED
jgi:acid phosphatase (class B)